MQCIYFFIIQIVGQTAVAYVPNMFGKETLLVIGGGKVESNGEDIREVYSNIEAFTINQTANPSNPLKFEKNHEKNWIDQFSPYVQVLEDRILIVQGGPVRQSGLFTLKTVETTLYI